MNEEMRADALRLIIERGLCGSTPVIDHEIEIEGMTLFCVRDPKTDRRDWLLAS